jgi:antitoxin HicB
MDKTVEYYLSLPYTIELIPEPEGGWYVGVKELPGCMSEGDTPEEAIEMIRDAMRGWIEIALEDGDPIPEPSILKEYSGKFIVRVPPSLHRDLAEMASEEGLSLNRFVVVALARAVGRPVQTRRSETEDTGWPGLKSAVQRVLAAAGLSQEAGELDERLFASWVEEVLAQVESALAGGYTPDALHYLEQLAQGLRAGAGKSPAVSAFYRMVSLLYQQVTEAGRLRQDMVEGFITLSRISSSVRLSIEQQARAAIQDERVAYSEISTRRLSSLLAQPEHNW